MRSDKLPGRRRAPHARYADYTEERDRAAAFAYKPPPLPKPSSEPAGLQHHHVRVTISPTSERDCGFVIDGTFTVDGGMVRGNQLLGSSPFKPGDDVEVLARKLPREKSVGGSGFSDWKPGDGATMPDIPAFLRRA